MKELTKEQKIVVATSDFERAESRRKLCEAIRGESQNHFIDSSWVHLLIVAPLVPLWWYLSGRSTNQAYFNCQFGPLGMQTLS